MKRRTRLLLRAAALAAGIAGAGWLLQRAGLALPLAITASVLLLALLRWAPRLAIGLFDALAYRVRAAAWREQQGRHHAFGGVALAVRDDGRAVWLLLDDWRRLTRSRDSDEVAIARHAAAWRRDDQGQIWLRVDAVVEVLAQGPQRADPRTLRLLHYLQRELLFPAAERRRRGAPDRGGRP